MSWKTRTAWAASALTLASACGSPETGSASLIVETGHETDTWSADPEAVQVVVQQTFANGTETTFATLEPPTQAEPLQLSLAGAKTGWFEVLGLDAAGSVRVRSQRQLVISEARAAIRVFAGRVGRFNRPPTELFVGQGQDPPMALLGDFALLAGARYSDAAVRLDAYDLSRMTVTAATLVPCPKAGCRTRSLAVSPPGLVVMVGEDWSVWADFSCGPDCTGTLALPEGLEGFGEVAGGETVLAPNGVASIVGATRADGPTTAVIQLHSDGWVVGFHHDTPRAGAAAAWVEGRGLLVVGGSNEPPGATVLDSTSSQFDGLPYPADSVTGASLVPFDDRLVLRTGGVGPDGEPAPSVVYDLECAENCKPAPFDAPLGLTDTSAFRLGDSVLVTGTASTGHYEARLVTAAQSTEVVELRDPRQGASALRTSDGRVLVAGGDLTSGDPALRVELYQPRETSND